MSAQGRDLASLLPRRGMERTLSIGEAIDAYLDDLRIVGSPASVSTYYHLLKPLPRDPPISAFTDTLARNLLADRIRAGGAMSSVKTAHGVMAGFASWCVLRGYLPVSPLRLVPCPRPTPPPHRYLSTDELRRLWAASDKTRHPAETRLILLLLLEGLRANELCRLRWQDVREDRIVVAFGKGRKPRVVPLTPSVRAALDARRVIGSLGSLSANHKTVFTLTVRALEDRLGRLGRYAGVPHVHPHLLRSTWASQELLAGASPENVRILVGWASNSDVFERYVASVREDAAIRGAVDLGELFQ